MDRATARGADRFVDDSIDAIRSVLATADPSVDVPSHRREGRRREMLTCVRGAARVQRHTLPRALVARFESSSTASSSTASSSTSSASKSSSGGESAKSVLDSAKSSSSGGSEKGKSMHSSDIAFKPNDDGWGYTKQYSDGWDRIFKKKAAPAEPPQEAAASTAPDAGLLAKQEALEAARACGALSEALFAQASAELKGPK